MADFDLVIRGGTIVDGSGDAGFVADIAVAGGRIAEIGTVTGSGRDEIDATGCLVTPGFVDIHTHYDGQVTWEHTLAPSSGHGVTTVVMGNCGVGFAPCRPEHRDTLIRVMEGVEDIPGIVMEEGVPWNWQTFPEYLDRLDRREYDIDIAAQVPHSPVRVFVMGARGADREAATDAELAAMRALVAEGITAGALGVTTSRVSSHRTRAGDLAPSVTAVEQELHALAGGLADAGAGVFQLVPESAIDSAEPVDDVAMFARLARTAGRPLSFTLIDRAPVRTADLLRLVADANRTGVEIKAQVYPRPIGILFGLELSLHPFRFRPSYAAIAELPLADRAAAMRDPAMRARLLAERPEHPNPIFTTLTALIDELTPLGDPPNYEPSPEDSVAARARRRGVTPAEEAYDLLLEQDGRMTLLLPKSNYVGHNLDSLAALLTGADVVIGLGDGGAHYGMICDASYPTFLLSYWTRDRATGVRLSLPWAVKALSRDTALAVGLADRGLLRPGYKADLNVIDYDRLALGAPFGVRDLPAGGRRLYQRAAGYVATVVGGVVTYRDGESTGALPGRLVRGAQAEPIGA